MKFAVMLIVSALFPNTVFAQSVPAPSRTVYRCEEAGKVRYSDTPCLGARRIDVEPTRGLSRSTGKELVGRDVRAEQQREMFADALRPLTGIDARQLDKAGRRTRLTREARQECRRLDQEIPLAEQSERQASNADVSRTGQEALLTLRTAFRESGCE